MGPPTTELLPERGSETTSPLTVDDARLSSLHSLKRVDTAEHPQAAEGARAAGGVGSPGTTTQSQELSSRQTIADPELELFFPRGMSRWPSSMETTSGGLEELKALPLKEQIGHMKNDFFKVSNLTTLS